MADPGFVPAAVRHDYFALISVIVYRIACVVFWGAVLPDYLASSGGVTPGGAPTGSLTYGVIALVLSILVTVSAYIGTTGRSFTTDDAGRGPVPATTVRT